jgi:hypothetical protein
MKGTILTHGLIAGLLIAATMFIGLNQQSKEEAPQFSQWIGYLIMIVALSLVFVGIKRYRDRELGGVIKFGTAFLLGLGITAVASVIYVVGWEINLSLTDYAFADDYARSVIAGKQAAGVAGEELAAEIAKMEEFKQQ